MAISKIGQMNIADISNTVTAGENIVINEKKIFRYGKVIQLYVTLTATAVISASNGTLITGLPKPAGNTTYGFPQRQNGKDWQYSITKNGELKFLYSPTGLSQNESCVCALTYLCA